MSDRPGNSQEMALAMAFVMLVQQLHAKGGIDRFAFGDQLREMADLLAEKYKDPEAKRFMQVLIKGVTLAANPQEPSGG